MQKTKIKTNELVASQLVSLAPTFSKDTFDNFYAEHYLHVGRFIQRRINFDADDILNEVFLVAWRKFNSIPKEVDKQRLWLCGTARRVIANKLRWKLRLDKFNRSVERLQDYSFGLIELSGVNLLVREALSLISPDHREILIFIEWDGFTTRDTALILEIPETTVTKRLHAARQSFAIAYKKLEPAAN